MQTRAEDGGLRNPPLTKLNAAAIEADKALRSDGEDALREVISRRGAKRPIRPPILHLPNKGAGK